MRVALRKAPRDEKLRVSVPSPRRKTLESGAGISAADVVAQRNRQVHVAGRSAIRIRRATVAIERDQKWGQSRALAEKPHFVRAERPFPECRHDVGVEVVLDPEAQNEEKALRRLFHAQRSGLMDEPLMAHRSLVQLSMNRSADFDR